MVSLPLFALIVIFSGIFNSSHSATVPKDKDAGKVMLCYYGSWATYRTDIAKFDVEDIDTSLCTHIIYTFMGLKDGVVTSLDPYNDYEENWGKGSLKKFSAHAKNNGIKALLAVGGWNQGSIKYSQMASTEPGRNKFADSAVDFVKKYNFDGLDLDWEYPTQRGGKPVDKENFSLLLATLSKKLHSAGLMLTVAITADATKGLQAYDFKKVSQYADYVSLMGFDFHTATSDNVTGLTAPLHRLKGESGDKAKLNLEYSIAQCLKSGVSASKLVVGIPTYGRTYRLKYRSLHGIGAPIIANGTAGIYTREAGFLAYYEICMDSNWIEVKNDAQGYVYAYYNNQWVSYDDVDTVTAKAELVKQKGLAGMMAWALESEDFRNMCGGGANPLLTAANKALGRQ